MGPAAKIAATCAIVVPLVVCFLGLLAARTHPQNAFLIVPGTALAILAYRLLPEIWEAARITRDGR